MFSGKPSVPESPFEVIKVTEDSISFSWKPSKTDGGSPITNYVLEMRESWKSKWRDCGKTEADTCSFTATRLKDGEEYFFRVCAENAVGQSDFLEMPKPVRAEKPKSKIILEILAWIDLSIVYITLYMYKINNFCNRGEVKGYCGS